MRIPGIAYVQGRNSYADPDGKHYGIAVHNTSNNASDEGEASYATRRTDGTSAHLYVDNDSVIQSLDTDARAGHAGSIQGNDNAIAVEITGGNGMSRDWWLSNVAWDELGRVLAYVITHDPDYQGFEVRRASVAEIRANPRVKALYGHDDMRQAWGGTTHVDPGPNFPWDKLFDCINAALTGPTQPKDDGMAFLDDLDARYLVYREYCWANMVEAVTSARGEVITHKGVATVNALVATVAAIAAKVDIDPAELEQIKQAAGAGVAAAVPAIVDALVAKLPADTLSRADVEAAVRHAIAGTKVTTTLDTAS